MPDQQVSGREGLVAFPKGKAIDFSELWLGASDVRTDLGRRIWKGGFCGRPQLASQLWPALRMECIKQGAQTSKTFLSAMRAFFRFLEAYGRQFVPIEDLLDLTEAVGMIWLHPPQQVWATPTRDHFKFVGRLLLRARLMSGGERGRFIWPIYPKANKIGGRDVPDELQARAALNILKREAQSIYRRWDRADGLAAIGRNLLLHPLKSGKFGFTVVEADLHATYRAIVDITGNPLPMGHDVSTAFGHQQRNGVPWFWTKSGFSLAEIQGGLYPLSDDISCLSQLFMARTGWNASTVYALDISNDKWALPYGSPEHGLWVIESWKNRSHDWQQTVSRGKTTTGPWYIVMILIDRTAPLRELMRLHPSRGTKGADAAAATSSPWIAAGQNTYSGQVITAVSQPGTPSMYWRSRVDAYNLEANEANANIEKRNVEIAKENARRAPDAQLSFIRNLSTIPSWMTPSDWRDIFANFVFVDSRYSWVVVQWALGHKHVRSVRDYLRRRLWRQFSEKKLLELQSVMFDEMRHSRLDVVVLRARVEMGFPPSEQDRARLDAHRKCVEERELTESGYQCQTPFSPPPEIDAENPSDGTMRCRRGERCPGCPAAIAVDAFHMVKRLVELERLRANVSATIWMESQLAADLEILRNDLDQWPSNETADYRVFWEEEFKSGRRQLNPWSSLN